MLPIHHQTAARLALRLLVSLVVAYSPLGVGSDIVCNRGSFYNSGENQLQPDPIYGDSTLITAKGYSMTSCVEAQKNLGWPPICASFQMGSVQYFQWKYQCSTTCLNYISACSATVYCDTQHDPSTKISNCDTF